MSASAVIELKGVSRRYAVGEAAITALEGVDTTRTAKATSVQERR